ncbi:polycystin-1-like protein 2 [Hyperolius riggenbachi]|uniref:polycystin-1-like protein 2 n=1 Tax=Hyperolius riggenbachi TaxID=752182 RepID=UPI0035A2CC01
MSHRNQKILLGFLALSFLTTHASSSPCSKYQVPYNNSCFEFVRHERTFHTAQSWCERGGGHLVYIQNQKTQEFLEGHTSLDADWWIGLVHNLQPKSDSHEVHAGAVTWLDTSNVSYSRWGSAESSGTGGKCGYIKKQSGYQWARTDNCTQEIFFICEFESGYTIACDNQNATVQCGSGEVVQISDSFYGRQSPHLCVQETAILTTSACKWNDVKEQVAGQCHGLQACQIAIEASLFGEPCPLIGSYLSIRYSCMEGLQLVLPERSLVSENVTITLKWLLTPFTGNLSCIINTGDGDSIDPYQPENVTSSVTHGYSSPGEYTVFVECSTSEWHVTAQGNILVEASSISASGCYSRHESQEEDCAALYGEDVWIQTELNAGMKLSL